MVSEPGNYNTVFTSTAKHNAYHYLDETTVAGTKWYKIQYSDSQVGWVSAKETKLVAVVALPSGSIVTAKSAPTNIRTSAGTMYPIITSVPKGTKLSAVGKIADPNGRIWYKVDIDGNGKYGYMHSNVVKLSSGGTADTVPVPSTPSAPAGSGVLTVTGDWVNVRTGPGLEYAKLFCVRKGTTYKYLESATSTVGKPWNKIEINGTTGWISGVYSKYTGDTVTGTTTPSTPTTPPANAKGIVTVSGGSVYVRTGPGTSYQKLFVAKLGQSYPMLGSAKGPNGRDWYIISINGTKGYISSKYATATAA